METKALEEKYVKGKIYSLPINKIQPDPEQPRKYFDETALIELMISIKQYGVLQPILFRKGQEGELLIVAGERRWKAATMAELNTIPALYIEGKTAEISLVENLLRENLTAVEEAEAFKAVIDKYGYKQDELAKTLGKSPSVISDILKLNKLPLEIRDECRTNPKCSRRVLLDIVDQKKQPKGMITLYKKYKEKGLIGGEIQKTSKPRRKGSAATSLITSLQAVRTKLIELEVKKMDEPTQKELKIELDQFKQAIEEKYAILRG